MISANKIKSAGLNKSNMNQEEKCLWEGVKKAFDDNNYPREEMYRACRKYIPSIKAPRNDWIPKLDGQLQEFWNQVGGKYQPISTNFIQWLCGPFAPKGTVRENQQLLFRYLVWVEDAISNSNVKIFSKMLMCEQYGSVYMVRTY